MGDMFSFYVPLDFLIILLKSNFINFITDGRYIGNPSTRNITFRR